MKIAELREKTAQELKEHAVRLRRQAFKLKLLKSNPEFKNRHEIKKVRRQIAQALTVLAQVAGQTS